MKTPTQSLTCLILTFTLFIRSNAKQAQPISDLFMIHQFWDQIHQWGIKTPELQSPQILISLPMVLAGVLCFIASAISSAGGIGGGGLFIPILTVVAKQDLKTASSLSSFMVTGGSIANVLCNMCPKGKKSMIDYDIALSSEPCMLLGVSVGVICNFVFPEWLITVLFALFLVWCTSKTCKSGLLLWKIESETKVLEGSENGSSEEPLLVENHEEDSKLRIPWLKLGVLLLIWLSFFSVYLLRGNRHGQSMIPMEPCGVGYWILSSAQVALAEFSLLGLCSRKKAFIITLKHNRQGQEVCRDEASRKLMFPLMALLAGMLGGIFGIGGGMLISPLLLQVGIAPETSLALAIACFVASLVGLLVVQRAVEKYKRASLIVFSIGIVMALSIVLITSFGAIQLWRDYTSGKCMGFKLPC